jgi:hypothetical protein
MTRTTIIIVAALALAATQPSISAHAAARDRVFVASYGNDSNPCTFGSPCKTFQQAVTVVAAGGEVTAIDSAGFGPISINKAVTITSPAGVEAGVVPTAGGDAIDIAAGPTDAVILRGLTLNGSNSGSNGIVLNSGGSLIVSDCVVENFVVNGPGSGDGILMQPSTGTLAFTITNTTLSNNGAGGIAYLPSGSPNANGVIDHVVLTGNVSQAINVYTGSASGGTTVLNFSNSIANDNLVGIILNTGTSGTPIKASIDNLSATGNSWGIQAFGNASVLLGRSDITGNTTGVEADTSSDTFYSFGNNQIGLNGTDGTSGLNRATYTLE